MKNLKTYLTIKIKHFQKELTFFSRAWDFKSDIDIHASLKSFELLFELSLKTIKTLYLWFENQENLLSQKDYFRWAFKKNLIAEPQPWFYFIKLRNNIVHEYFDEDVDEEKVQEIKNSFPSFLKNINVFLNALIKLQTHQ